MTQAERSRRRVGRWITLSFVLLMLAVSGVGYWLYTDLSGKIKGINLDKAIGDERPAKVPSAGQNVLVLGSDSRSGVNSSLGTGRTAGARSDTALLIHISEGRRHAVAVSIPRDTLVTRPVCKAKDGSSLPAARRVMFNSVYSLAGSACVVKTVEQMSGVRMDHFVELDFAGFKGVVDAIGGVTVTVERDIHDKSSGLDLEAGTHKLNGTQSLQFVRTRHSIGDGSDLGRIGLQQQFLIALLGEIKKQELLGSPAKAYRIADRLTASLTTDSGLASLTKLAEFGRSINGVDPSTMETIMLPVRYDAQDPNRVVPAQPQVSRLWQALRTDQKIPESAKKSPAVGGLAPKT
ncbi:LCP family protein required for cell wall assembly [Streptomyces sp. V4I8]|uniref:LCP family protein n=1 Tax=Streptomyces sp. V4I8 TaxID=3156469 RepID=UPI00351902F2